MGRFKRRWAEREMQGVAEGRRAEHACFDSYTRPNEAMCFSHWPERLRTDGSFSCATVGSDKFREKLLRVSEYPDAVDHTNRSHGMHDAAED